MFWARAPTSWPPRRSRARSDRQSALYPRQLVDLCRIDLQSSRSREDLVPGVRVHRNTLGEAFCTPLALRFARQAHLVETRTRWRRANPVEESARLALERRHIGDRLRIEDDGEHAVQHALFARGRPAGKPGGERAAEQLACNGHPVALVLAERKDRTQRFDHRISRIVAVLALVVDDASERKLVTFVVRDARLALRDHAGSEVEQNRIASRQRNADSERIGDEAPVAAAERRDDRTRDDVDEMDRHEALGYRHLRPGADAAQMVCVSQRHDAAAEFLRALDAERHRLVADNLAKSCLAVDAQQRAAVHQHFDVRVCLQPALDPGFGVAREHADAVRIVAAEVGLDQVFGHQLHLAFLGSETAHQLAYRHTERLGADEVCVSHVFSVLWSVGIEPAANTRCAPGAVSPFSLCANPSGGILLRLRDRSCLRGIIARRARRILSMYAIRLKCLGPLSRTGPCSVTVPKSPYYRS